MSVRLARVPRQPVVLRGHSRVGRPRRLAIYVAGATGWRSPMAARTRFTLGEEQIPKAWYNISADLPVAQFPPLHPGTHQPLGPADLAPLFPMALIMQEVSTEREIEIPDPVRDLYKQFRPSPLVRALRLEKALDTPAHIYYKNEGVSPAGSHKPNTAIPQAFYNKQEGINRIATETGAGQWGSALAYAGALPHWPAPVS